MSEQLKEERSLLNIILQGLDDAEAIVPDVVMEKNFMKVKHNHKAYKITVEQQG